MTAERLMLIGGISAFLLTISWLRNRLIAEKHAIAWLFIATCLLMIGLFPGLIMAFADASRLSYPSAVLFLSLSVIYFFSMRVSRSLTDTRRELHRLKQDFAIANYLLQDMRKQLGENPHTARPHNQHDSQST